MRCPSALALTFLAAAAGVAAWPREVVAYACYEPAIRVFSHGAGAPTDAIVRLRFPGAEAGVYRLGEGRVVLESARVRPEDTVFVLRAPDGSAVPMRRRILDGTELPLLELVPARPLAANTEYRVVVRRGGSDFFLDAFTTGASAKSPELETPTAVRARFVRLAHVEYKETSGPWVRVVWKKMASPPPLFEVHALGDDDAIGKGTLRAVVEAGPTGLVFGHTSLCEPQDVVFPKSGKARYALRPLDWAGHAGAPLRITVDLDHPSPVDPDR
jgi:hypothetical protein